MFFSDRSITQTQTDVPRVPVQDFRRAVLSLGARGPGWWEWSEESADECTPCGLMVPPPPDLNLSPPEDVTQEPRSVDQGTVAPEHELCKSETPRISGKFLQHSWVAEPVVPGPLTAVSGGDSRYRTKNEACSHSRGLQLAAGVEKTGGGCVCVCVFCSCFC